MNLTILNLNDLHVKSKKSIGKILPLDGATPYFQTDFFHIEEIIYLIENHVEFWFQNTVSENKYEPLTK